MQVGDPIAAVLGQWSSQFGISSILFRIILSVLLSAIIGCERSSKRHSAGLRTFILVSLASSAASLTDVYLMSSGSESLAAISAAAVVGAAMISGNTILFSSKSQIKGLTTSAGLWACALVGLSAGAGLYTVSLASFTALLICLSLLPRVEKALKDRSNHFEIHLELKNKNNLQDFVGTIRNLGMRIDDIESNPAYLSSGLSVYSVSLTIFSPELKKYKKHSEIIGALRTLEYIYYVEEMN